MAAEIWALKEQFLQDCGTFTLALTECIDADGWWIFINDYTRYASQWPFDVIIIIYAALQAFRAFHFPFKQLEFSDYISKYCLRALKMLMLLQEKVTAKDQEIEALKEKHQLLCMTFNTWIISPIYVRCAQSRPEGDESSSTFIYHRFLN